MYRDTDYLNYTDLNEVEERIKEQHEILECVNISTPDFHPKNWKLNDFPYIQEIDRIERGVNDLGEYYYKPNGWQECKTWLTGKETSQIIKSFSYLDINRWINNYSLMKNIFSGYKFEKINGTKIKINSLINQKAKSLTIEGKSEQETRSGKNLLYVSPEVREINGLTITKNEDGSITINGTSTAISYCNINTNYSDNTKNKYFTIEKDKSYTAYLDKPLEGLGLTVRTLSKNYFIVGTGVGNDIGTANYTKDTDEYAFAYLGIHSGKTFDNVTIYPMVVEGKYTKDTIGEFEPYGAMPSPDYPSEIKNVDGIRNLFDKDNTPKIEGYLDNNALKFYTATNGRYCTYKECKPNTTYTISKKAGVRFTVASSSEVLTNNSTLLNAINDNTATSITIKTHQNAKYLCIWYCDSLEDEETMRNSIQIEEGLIANDYIPYGSNYLPIVNRGKNLLNPNGTTKTMNGITLTNNGDGTFTINGTATANVGIGLTLLDSNLITLKNGITYTQTLEVLSGNFKGSIVPAFKDTNGTIKYNYFASSDTKPISSVKTTDEMTLSFYNYYASSGTTVENVRFRVQLEEGNATNYEPYREPTTTLINLKNNELCSIRNVKDELSIKNGKAKIIKRIGKVVLDGSEIISMPSTNQFNIDNALKDYAKKFTDISYISDFYIPIEKTGTNRQFQEKATGYNYCFNLTTATSNTIRFKNVDISSIDDFKTWLSTHNTTVYYVLSEPYEIELDDYDIELFDGVNNISLDDDLDTNMECEYIKEIGNYTTIWNLQSFIKWNEASDLEWSDE